MGFESCAYNCDDNCDIFCHIILHPAVHIYNFHIFIMLWRANVNNKLLEFSSHAMFVLELSIVT